jgi:zinc protease
MSRSFLQLAVSGLLATTCALVAAQNATPSSQTAPAPASQQVVERSFPNGLKVLVKPDRRAPTVAHMVWYRAGSMDEVNGRTGVAHVLEHMMFKGTESLAPGEFSRRVAAMVDRIRSASSGARGG